MGVIEEKPEGNLLISLGNGDEPEIWTGLKSIDFGPESNGDEIEYVRLRLSDFSGSFTCIIKAHHMSRKFFRHIRRWSRKKEQQHKRKREKEKKNGLLYKKA